MFQETFIVQLPELCPLNVCVYACLHHSDSWQKHKSVHARISSKQAHGFLHGDFPLHEHTRSCKRSADTGPSKYTGCSESCPFCRLYSNGGGIWGFATCQAVQIWVSSISAASDGDNLTKLASRLVATITRNLFMP
jgi:hypothetical protein